MVSFFKALEEVAGIGSVIAIDVFFVHKYRSTRIKSFTYSKEEYRDDILPDFINRNGSIGGINQWKSENESYGNFPYEKPFSKMAYKDDFEFKNAPRTKATFSSFIDHLKNNNFGNHCFWNNVNQKVGGAETNISAIVILGSENLVNKEKLKGVVYENLLKDFYRLIIGEFVDINEKQTKKILRHERDKEFIKAHKHTIRNFGLELSLSNIDFALKNNKLDKAKEILSRVQKLNLLRDITLDFIYQINNKNTYNNKLLLVEKLSEMGGLKYSGILKIINDATTFNNDYLKISKEVENHQINIIDEKKIVSVFNLLVNLFSNVEKHSNTFEVVVQILQGALIIEFKNDSPINDNSIVEAYLTKNIDCVSNHSYIGDGIGIIIEALIDLSFSLEIKRSKKHMNIILKIL